MKNQEKALIKTLSIFNAKNKNCILVEDFDIKKY